MTYMSTIGARWVVTAANKASPWIVAICLLAMAVNARAQRPTGQQDYQHYCAVCHGPKGKGNGEASYTLPGTNPPDLTQLSRRNGGKFPFEDVDEIVDGRKEFPSHERLNMPFFGTDMQMEEGATPQGEAKTDARITAIVRYIETLQQK
jgi:mono/diheme cytochrome c family protein